MSDTGYRRVLVVTGGFGFLGSTLAAHSVRQGNRVAVIDAAPVPTAEVAGKLGPDILMLGGVNLTDFEQTKSAFETITAHFGGLDALVNAAGGFRWQTLEEGDLSAWDMLYALNVKTAANACRAALPGLRRSQAGRIINIGANAALKAAAGMGAYTAAKAGLHRLTESLAEELKADNITVNAVLPSILDTPVNRQDMPNENFSRWVAPSDLAAVILFLGSPAAAAVTGALLPVTGRV